jgi:hypothetical protein
MSTDGLKMYFHAIAESFGNDIDYGTIHKIYGAPTEESGANVTLRVTPAMEAGLSSHVWSIAEIVNIAGSHVAIAA